VAQEVARATLKQILALIPPSRKIFDPTQVMGWKQNSKIGTDENWEPPPEIVFDA
jgi:hypothetical protein